MGILLSAMAGAGDAGVQSINQNIAQQHALDLEKMRSDLAAQKAKDLALFNNELALKTAERQRQAMLDNINTAKSGIMGSAMNSTFGDYDAALAGHPNSGTPLTPEQMAVIQGAAPTVAAEKPAALAQLANDPQTYISAAIQSGYIAPDKVADIAHSSAALRQNAELEGKRLAASAELEASRESHQDKRDAASRAFQAGENAKQRALEHERMTTMYGDGSTVEAQAQAIAAGKQAPLTGVALRSPRAAKVMERVMEINPAYDAKDYASQAAAIKTFTSGKQGNMVRSFNVGLDHLDTLGKLSTALNNGNMQDFNRLSQFIAEKTGSAAPSNFDAVKHIVADEIVKAVTGGAGALGDREAAAATLKRANSPAQLQGVIDHYKELMKAQLGGLRLQYQQSTGRNDFDRFLTPAAQSVMGGTHNGNGAPNPAAQNAGAMPDDIAALMNKYGR